MGNNNFCNRRREPYHNSKEFSIKQILDDNFNFENIYKEGSSYYICYPSGYSINKEGIDSNKMKKNI